MTIDNRVKIWIRIAEYDIETARAMLKSKRYVYVGFMCQQALEKLLKAEYLAEKSDEPPYTHNLRLLADSLSISFPSETVVFLNELIPYYFAGRYPTYKEAIAKKFTKEHSQKILRITEEIFEWLLFQLKQKER